MKNILITLLTITIISIFTGCADKTPFKEQTPLANSALVYVYAAQVVTSEDGSTDGKFQLLIDDKSIGITLVENEYTPINLKAQKVMISATKDALITKEIVLDLKAGNVYYLRAKLLNGGDFNFEKINTSIALKEITKTRLHGSFMQNKIDALVKVEEEPQSKKPQTAQIKKSKLEQIKDANQLKIDGIITQEEFEKLKADILDVN